MNADEPATMSADKIRPVVANPVRLAASHLHKRYRSRSVVKDVSFDVSSGEIVGLLGPNGAGKTTCFYMVLGLITADSGDIYMGDKRLTHLSIHQRAHMGLAYLPQESSIFRKMTAGENIRAVLELQKLSSQEIEQQQGQLMEELHIAHLRDNMAVSLSGGERRRVEIARALANKPQFILLDEPFAGVDPIAVIDIKTIIRFLKHRNIGVLITDHNVREMLSICDHATIINDGHVLASGQPEEVIHNESVRQVYLGREFRL